VTSLPPAAPAAPASQGATAAGPAGSDPRPAREDHETIATPSAASNTQLWHVAAGLLALAGYALLSHLLMVHAAHEPWAVAALLAPMLGAAAGLALHLRNVRALLACGVAAVVLAAIVARGGIGSVERLYLLQHMALHAALGSLFALTLRPGATALITAMAHRVQGPLSVGLQRYTRRLTAVWVAYFAGMVLLSPLLFVLAPWWGWSLYANLLTPLAATALFIGEFLLRYRLHPEFERVTFLQTVFAWRNTSLAPPRREGP